MNKKKATRYNTTCSLTESNDSLIFWSTISRAQNPSSRKVKSKSDPVREVMVFVQDWITKETVKENVKGVIKRERQDNSLYSVAV